MLKAKVNKFSSYSPLFDESKRSDILSELQEEPNKIVQLLVSLVDVSLRLYDYYCITDFSKAKAFAYETQQIIKEKQFIIIENPAFNKADREFIKGLLKYWNSKVEDYSIELIEKSRQDTVFALVKQLKYQEALDTLDEYYKQSKKVGNDEETISILVDIAVVYRQKGDLNNALYYFDLAAKNDRRYLFEVGYTFAEMSKFDDAIEAYKAFLKIAPKNKFAWNNIGWSYLAKNDNSRALQSFEHALSLDYAVEPLLGKASVYSSMKKFNPAIKLLQEVLAMKPGHRGALIDLVHLYNDCLHDWTKTLYYAKLALELHPNHFYAKPNYAESLVLVGRYDEAIKEAQETIPSKGYLDIDMAMYFTLAVAYFLKNQPVEAMHNLKLLNNVYIAIPSNFKNGWSYSGIKYFVDISSLDKSAKEELFKVLTKIEAIPARNPYY